MHFLFVDFAGCFRPDSFENGNNVEIAAVQAAGENRSTIDKHRRAIQPRHGNATPWHVLVAAADRHKAIKPLASDHSFDRIGNDFTRNQRIFHSLSSHRDAVRYGDCIENGRLSAGVIHAGSGFTRELIDVHVAGSDHAPGRGHTDLRFGKIVLPKTDWIQHRTAGSATLAIQNNRRKRTQIVFCRNLGSHELYYIR